MSAVEIVAQHPGLTLADVHAALADYHDHRAEIDADIRADEEFVQQLRAGTPSVAGKVEAPGATDQLVSPVMLASVRLSAVGPWQQAVPMTEVREDVVRVP